ncbi:MULTISPECIES: M23 family metallopeptidase [Brachybacterium]|uniref:Metalloendopeptidase n=2 Tax=Brachybacterium TaxID=43668 RepID=A0A426SHW6_9MICO|nr:MULTISPECIES: M23 family metallopeptidase [Brachybacterium]MCT1436917.1 peptidoglycan DD-metalloendopeptidase family protein [Brachybacterium paraconglomeratum]RRR17743.1 metalloendopeptidase [Brachybacterium paraconglomeratum]GLI30931.1 metalloendopeptidase [Brachybacterium conglomeratum]GLK05826.1 metalloendopeptidase [Brachybacterium conglomeratum]
MSSRSLRRPLSLLAAAAILAAGMLTGPVVSPASAEGSKDDKIAERAEVDQQLEDLRIELNDVNDDLADTYLALAETELLIPQAQQDLEDARVALGEAQEEDRKVGERLTEAEEEERRLSGEVETGQEEVDRSDDELATVALSAYKGGGMPSPSTVYVGNSSPQDAVDRSMNYRLTMASQGTHLDALRTDQSVTENSAERLSAVREEIKQLKIDAEDALERTRVAEEEATEAKNELDALYETQKTQRDDLEAKKTKYEGDQKSLETRSSTLDDEIEELAEQEREREEKLKAQQQQKSSGGSAPVAGSANTGGGWVYPVNARLNSNFGWRVHPIYGTKKLHAGVDFPVACGVPVGAAHSGRVVARTYNSGAGNKLIVSHGIMNGRLVTTSYHHLQGFAKPVGAQVSAGETVGYVGTTGSSTGCHLHFETHEDGNAVNPAKFL